MARLIDGINQNDYAGAKDLINGAGAPTKGGDWIEVDGDGDSATTDDKVLVNKLTGEVYIGDNVKGTVKIDSGFVARAKAAGMTVENISDVILDDDTGDTAAVKINVDIGRLLMDNDALNGGVAKADVEVTGQTDALNVISDMDSKVNDIKTAGTTLGVDADLTIDKGTLVFSGSNDVIFDAKKEGADGLVVNNNFDINQKQGSTEQITVNGKVTQNINYSDGVGQTTGGGPTEWDWAWMKTFSKTSRPLDSTNSIGLEVGGTRNGKTIKDVRINAHKGVTVTLVAADGTITTETITLQNQGGIAVYDRSKGTLVLVADKVYTWTNPAGGVTTTTTSSGAGTSGTSTSGTSTSGTTTDGTTSKKSDPTNHFGLHGNINASTLEIDQNNKGKIGSDVGTLEWLARNEVMTDAGAVITKGNIKQSLDITVEGNGGQIKLTDTSGNWINTENVTTKDNAKVLVKGNSMTKDGLGGLNSIKDDPNAFKIETYTDGTGTAAAKFGAATFGQYRQLLAPDAYVRLIEKLKLLNKAADITKEDVVAAAKEVGANNLDTEQIEDLMSIIDGTGDAKINGDDINTMTIDTPTA